MALLCSATLWDSYSAWLKSRWVLIGPVLSGTSLLQPSVGSSDGRVDVQLSYHALETRCLHTTGALRRPVALARRRLARHVASARNQPWLWCGLCAGRIRHCRRPYGSWVGFAHACAGGRLRAHRAAGS